ncbi:MAG: M48 family metallopeptidase [Myxococcaceae bacterium]
MKRTLTLVVFTVALQGCALFSSIKSGNLPDPNAVKAEAERVARLTKESADEASAKCAPILKEEIGWEEERAVGGVVAVSKLKDNKAFVDGESEKKPDVLVEAVKAGKPVLLPDSPKNEISAQLSIIGRNLARLSGRPDLPWTFGVLESETPNALSAPGGYVFVTSGLLKKVTNEAQLAGVLSHEIAHVVLKHSLLKYRDGKEKQCTAANTVANLAKKGIPPSEGQKKIVEFALKFDGKLDLDNSDGDFIKFLMDTVIQILQGGNDKESEFAADKMALELTAFAGYDATEYEKLLSALGGGGGLSTHPAAEDRVAKLKALREGELAPFATGTAKADLSKLLAPVNGK